MDFKELAFARSSVRGYTQQPVDAQQLDYIMECANAAPTACNRQPVAIYIVQDAALRQEVARCYLASQTPEWLLQAPTIIVLATQRDKAWVRRSDNKNHCDIDAAIIADHITLAAAQIGLGTCWICNFNADSLSNVLSMPENESPVVMLSLGHAANESTRPKTRSGLKINTL